MRNSKRMYAAEKDKHPMHKEKKKNLMQIGKKNSLESILLDMIFHLKMMENEDPYLSN